MDWRLAESLKKLCEQVNAAYPGRDKASDGSIGDASHASRNSDHNPWIFDGRTHVVSAIDIDEDLTGSTHTLEAMITAIRNSRDPRVKYIIYEGRITVAGTQLQQWKPYTGKNAHRHHAHISVFPARNLYDDRSEWSIGQVVQEMDSAAVPAAGTPEPVTETAAAEPASSEANSAAKPPINQTAVGFTPEKFNAFVPQIDTAKSWLKRAAGGTGMGAALAFVFKLPEWLQIGLFALLVIIVIGGIVTLIKYHGEIFAYVTKMNTLRASDSSHDPVIVGRPPTD